MENDEPKNINLLIANNHNSINVFKLQYKNQNVYNNIEYQKWKKLMLTEYGNNSKQFKCNKDKILFYSTYNDCIYYPYYKCICPICNNYICYFCSFNSNDEFIICCIKNSFFNAIFYYGPKSINEPFDKSTLFMLFPGLNIFVIVLYFFNFFYIELEKENSKDDNNEEKYIDYDKNKKYILNLIIIISIGLLISIPFAIIYNYLIVFLIIISIPFKFIPLKYYLGALKYT